MSGASTQDVGLAASAKAEVVSAVSAAAIKKVLVENPVILHAPKKLRRLANLLNKSRTSLSRQYDEPIRRSPRPGRLCDFPRPAWRLCSGFSLEQFFARFARYVLSLIHISE